MPKNYPNSLGHDKINLDISGRVFHLQRIYFLNYPENKLEKDNIKKKYCDTRYFI